MNDKKFLVTLVAGVAIIEGCAETTGSTAQIRHSGAEGLVSRSSEAIAQTTLKNFEQSGANALAKIGAANFLAVPVYSFASGKPEIVACASIGVPLKVDDSGVISHEGIAYVKASTLVQGRGDCQQQSEGFVRLAHLDLPSDAADWSQRLKDRVASIRAHLQRRRPNTERSAIAFDMGGWDPTVASQGSTSTTEVAFDMGGWDPTIASGAPGTLGGQSAQRFLAFDMGGWDPKIASILEPDNSSEGGRVAFDMGGWDPTAQ